MSIFFEKSLQEIQVSIKSDQSNGPSHEDQHTNMIVSHSILLTMRNISDGICRENQNTHVMFNKAFPKVITFFRSGQPTDDHMAQAHCMLDT